MTTEPPGLGCQRWPLTCAPIDNSTSWEMVILNQTTQDLSTCSAGTNSPALCAPPFDKQGQGDPVSDGIGRCIKVVRFDSEDERWPSERVGMHRPSGFQGQLEVLGPADLSCTVTRRPPRSPQRGRANRDALEGRAPLGATCSAQRRVRAGPSASHPVGWQV
jgi:hypothetical protein